MTLLETQQTKGLCHNTYSRCTHPLVYISQVTGVETVSWEESRGTGEDARTDTYHGKHEIFKVGSSNFLDLQSWFLAAVKVV